MSGLRNCQICGSLKVAHVIRCENGCAHPACAHCFSHHVWEIHLPRNRQLRDRRALPPDGPDIGADVPGGGAI